MDRILEVSLQLLQATELLQQYVEQGELEKISEIQEHRGQLVTELDAESRKPWPRDVLSGCQSLVQQTRIKEREITQTMTAKREAIGREHDQLQRNQQARKAYGNFS